MTSTVVLDSSVFNKTYLDEEDRNFAVSFLRFAREGGVTLVAPSIFVYEVLAVAAPTRFGASAAWDLIKDAIGAGLRIRELDDSVIERAIEIADFGHPKSGFPTIYDSTYHALALDSGGVFLTADARHVAKAKSFGGILLLHDWERHFAR